MTQKTKKIIDKVFSITWWVALGALFVLCFGIVRAKIKGEVPQVFGYSVVKVISPSMGEDIPVGTYVLIKKVDPKDVKIGQIICFYSDDPAIKGSPNLHRVAADPIKNGDKYEYITKGDANAVQDSVTAKSEKLIGKYVDNIDWLTNLSEGVSSKGMLVFVAGLATLSVGMIVVIVTLKSKDQAEEEQGAQTQANGAQEQPTDTQVSEAETQSQITDGEAEASNTQAEASNTQAEASVDQTKTNETQAEGTNEGV